MRSFWRGLVTTVATGAAAAGPVPVGDLLPLGFQLVNRNSDKCLAVTADGLDDNAILIQRQCTTAYRWRFTPVAGTGLYQVRNVTSGRCLTIVGDSLEDNGFAVQYRCTDDPSQRWRIRRDGGLLDSDALLENARSHKCLTIAGGSAAENGVAVQYHCDAELSRRWRLPLAV